MVLPICQFSLGLALPGSCQIGLSRVCKPQVGQVVLLTERNILLFYFISKGSLVDPRLRASNEHIPTVRVPRAGGRSGYPLVSQSSPGNSAFSFIIIMVRIMDLLPVFRSRQRPVVEIEPRVRKAFQEFHLGARTF